jgi:hypothetical protein
MKNFFKITLLLGLASWIVGCSTDERFTGSPLDSGLNIVTLEGTVSVDIDADQLVLSGQDLAFTATLPVNKVFNDTVTVEVTSTAQSGGRTRGYADIMPGESSGTGKISAVGGSVYNTTFSLKMTAINLQTVEPGIHYLMTSNSISILTGSTTVPSASSDRLIIRVVSQNATSSDRFVLNIDRPDPGINGTGLYVANGGYTEHFLRVANSPTTESASFSWREGTYTLSLSAPSGLPDGTVPRDKEYRIIIVKPNGESEVFNGVYEGLTATSPQKPVLSITKTVNGDNVEFTATEL